jgi:glycosyltransferase involved in cell wall biosynthesis
MILTEHGIYTNERRIEIASAEWIEEAIQRALTVDDTRSSLRDFWIDSFTNYSRMCYEAADEIITLYSGNQIAQLADGADAEKMAVIPNGVDVERFSKIEHKSSGRPTVALIGRVVPIKDIKSFIRACGSLNDQLPDLKAYIMGSHDEDPDYYQECLEMVEYMNLSKVIEFTGQVNIDNYFPEIDVIVMTSISEAQPLVILEAGAAGIPCVATNVGACSEMILGHDNEYPALGDGGIIVPLSNPLATANAMFELLTNSEKYEACSDAIRKRVSTQYTKEMQHSAYKTLYDDYVEQGSRSRKSAA